MNYKGYGAKVIYDEKAEIFHGEVIGLKDVITFQSDNTHELKAEFKKSVDEYLSFCKEMKREPERPFSGKFVLRLNPELHRELYIKAIEEHKSLNEIITERLVQTQFRRKGISVSESKTLRKLPVSASRKAHKNIN